MKRLRNFCFSMIPALILFAIQNLALFLLLGIVFLTRLFYTQQNGQFQSFETLSFCMKLLSNQNFLTWTMVAYGAAAAALFGIWYYNGFSVPSSSTHQKKKGFIIAGLLFLVPAAQYLTVYFVTFLSSIFPSWLADYERLMESSGMTGAPSLSLFLYSVLLAPLSEELIFRGVTLNHLKRAFPFWIANLFQAVFFGFLHLNMLQGIYAFCLGILMGYLYEKGGSIFYSFFFHMLFNFFGVFLMERIPWGNSLFSAVFLLIGPFIFAGIGMSLFHHGIRKPDDTPKNISYPNEF